MFPGSGEPARGPRPGTAPGPAALSPPARHLLHGLEQRLPIILERHDELELSAPRLHGCRGGKETQGHPPPRAGLQAAGPARHSDPVAGTLDVAEGPRSAWELGVPAAMPVCSLSARDGDQQSLSRGLTH